MDRRSYRLELDREDDGKLRALARHHKLPMSEVLRQAIRREYASFEAWIPREEPGPEVHDG